MGCWIGGRIKDDQPQIRTLEIPMQLSSPPVFDIDGALIVDGVGAGDGTVVLWDADGSIWRIYGDKAARVSVATDPPSLFGD